MKFCVENSLLTQWQCEQLASGKHKGFFLGKFKLVGRLGAGGMSTVFLGEHTLSGQRRALKILPKAKLKEKSYLTRFYREGQSIAKLKHPNIVRIYDIAKDGENHFMVMEYVQGADLDALVKRYGPLNFDHCRQTVSQSAAGLAHAHLKNLVHRDVKPANLVWTKNETIKVLDLGLALLKTTAGQFGLSEHHNETLMGTVDYLAPEQAINSHDLDHRADIYSLGCTLYFLLTGQPPFPTGTLAQRIAGHQNLKPQSIDSLRDDCPADLVSICNKMMCKNPDERFQSCDDLIIALKSDSIVKFDSAAEIETNESTVYHQAKSKKRSLLMVYVMLSVLILIVVVLALLVANGSLT